MEVIETAHIKLAQQIVSLPKKHRPTHVCAYRKPNVVTIRDSYPVPDMIKFIDKRGDTTEFSTSESNSELESKNFRCMMRQNRFHVPSHAITVYLHANWP